MESLTESPTESLTESLMGSPTESLTESLTCFTVFVLFGV